MAKYRIEFKDPSINVPREVTADYWDLDKGEWFDFYESGGDDSPEVIVVTVCADAIRSITRTSS